MLQVELLLRKYREVKSVSKLVVASVSLYMWTCVVALHMRMSVREGKHLKENVHVLPRICLHVNKECWG